MKSLLILGRQPALGLAEAESLYGPDAITIIGQGGALLDIEPGQVNFGRLGGSIKLAKVAAILDTSKWRGIEDYLSENILEITSNLPEGKLRLGISAYGLRVNSSDINVTGLRLKKIVKAGGRSVRVVPNKQPELNSAQVLHNQLTGPTGVEIVAARYNDKTVLAITVAEQDIEAYAKRDQNRPARDAKVGMLPPKLAQVLINLASGQIEGGVILDPFCGTGVLLQEALLMGCEVAGTDIDPRMVEYTEKNLNWLADWHPDIWPIHTFTSLAQGDATTFNWQKGPQLKPLGSKATDYIDGYFDIEEAAIACETYLGKPLTSLPSRQVLDKIMAECDEIHAKFLRNIGSQIKPGTPLCLAVPAWRAKNGFLHLKTLDHLTEMGYTRKKFVHVRDEELIYHRPDQTVARELVVLTRM